MIKKIFLIILVIFNILSIIYLAWPTPTLTDLPNSVRSTLPGDTVQLSNVAGYYTNLSRTEVINFYLSIYSGPLRIRLNHPPEKSKTIFRDTMQSYYLEELVLPFKQSLFINGFEWEKDVFTKPEKRIANKLIYENITYPSKITIRTFTSSLPARLITFFSIEITLFLIIILYRQFFKSK